MNKPWWLLATLATGCVAGEIGSSDELVPQGQLDVMVHSRRPMGDGSYTEQALSAGAAPRVLFLNRAGGTYTAGWDDSAHHVSSVVQGQKLSSVTIPANTWSNTTWGKFLACVQDEYARWDINVTDQRPASGAYIEGVIGGTGAELGFGQGIGGVAPVDTYQCQPITTAIGFIFTGNSWAQDPIVACEIASHELGHSVVPLDHEYLAADPMTYLNYNGHKTFQDQAAQCGEYQPRACFCNRPSQNTVQLLSSTLGPHKMNPPPPPPPPPSSDKTPPMVSIVAPDEGANLPENSPIEVTIDARDNVGVQGVSLFWTFSNKSIPCDNSVAGFTCTQSGSQYTWSFTVGTGQRQFYATATDAAGNVAQTPTRTISLGTPMAPPADAPPEVRVDGPAGGTVITPGGPLTIQATVHDDGNITDVTVHWTNNGSTSDFAAHESAPGVFAFSSTLSAAAQPGPRSFTVTATDDAGNQTTSPAVILTVQ
jgi:hypothetical protein